MAIDKSGFPALRTDVSIMHHPDTVATKWSVLDEDGTSGQVALTSGIAAAKAVYAAQAEALDIRKSLAKYVKGEVERTTKGPVIKHGFEDQYAQGVNKIKANALRLFDSHQLQVSRSYEHLLSKLKNGLKDSTTSRELQQEIRSFVRSMDKNKRTQWLMSQPLQTIAAVMAAPTYLSGLDDNQIEIIRTNALKRFMPVESAQFEHVDGVLSHLIQVRHSFTKWADDEIASANTPAARAIARVREFAR